MKIVAIGDNCVDIYVNLNKVCPGGGSVNFAAQASRAGADAAYIGAIGTDVNGELISSSLIAEKVDISGIQKIDGKTGYALVELRDSERIFIGSDHGVREMLQIDRSIQKYIAGFDLIHTTLDGNVDEYIPGWKQQGMKISYDFSHRYKPSQLALLPNLYVAFFSGQNFTIESGIDYLKKVFRDGPELIVMTFGEKGSIAFDGENIYHHTINEPIIAKDTLGAGDSFQAGFMVAYLNGATIDVALTAGAKLAANTINELGGFGHSMPLNKE